MKHLDPTLCVLIFSAHTSTGTTFVYCFMGSLTTEQFLGYSDIVYESDWYKMPIDMQKLLQFVIIDAQRPHIFNGFGIIDSNLTTFVKVIHTCRQKSLFSKSYIRVRSTDHENGHHLLHDVQEAHGLEEKMQ